MLPLRHHLGPLSFYREAVAIALPVMLQQLIMSMVSLIDNFMVAGLGDISMAAVNVANHLAFIYIVIINTICQAGGIYIAQFRGAGDYDGMKHAYRFKALFGVASAVLYLVVCQLIPGPLLAMLTTGNAAQEEIVAVGSQYLNIVSFSFPFLAISSAVGTSFREIAKPKVPLLISAAATLVNTLGNWILIYGNLGAPRLEVVGAGYATIIARLFELAVFLAYASRVKPPFYVSMAALFHVNGKLIREIFSKSGMIFVSELSWVSSETVMIAMYNRRGGAEVVAGMAAGWTIANLFLLIMGGTWVATVVLVGGSLGGGRLDEARRRADWLKSGSVAAGLILAVIGAALSALIIPLVFFNLSAAARANCFGLVLVILAYLPFWGLLNTQYCVSRAGGDTAMGMYTDLSVNTVLFVPAAFVLSYLTLIPPVPMFAILKTTDILKIFICRHFLRRERWVRNLAVRKGAR